MCVSVCGSECVRVCVSVCVSECPQLSSTSSWLGVGNVLCAQLNLLRSLLCWFKVCVSVCECVCE